MPKDNCNFTGINLDLEEQCIRGRDASHERMKAGGPSNTEILIAAMKKPEKLEDEGDHKQADLHRAIDRAVGEDGYF